MNSREIEAFFGVDLKGKCGCAKCQPEAWWMVVCVICGNKRCPHAADHDNLCTNSNEPGQPGSNYPWFPAQPPKS